MINPQVHALDALLSDLLWDDRRQMAKNDQNRTLDDYPAPELLRPSSIIVFTCSELLLVLGPVESTLRTSTVGRRATNHISILVTAPLPSS